MARPGTTRGPRPSPKVSHFFFQRTRLITHSNHRERHLMKKLLGQLLRSISGGISPGGIAIPSSFYGWIFFRLSIASSPKKFKVFFSLPKLPSIDVDVQICLGVPKCPHFAPRLCSSLLSVSITKKVIDMKNSSYTCCGYIWQDICWDADVYRW